MKTEPDIIERIHAALSAAPLTHESVSRTLAQVRQEFGGDTVYVRAPVRPNVTRRAAQIRRARSTENF